LIFSRIGFGLFIVALPASAIGISLAKFPHHDSKPSRLDSQDRQGDDDDQISKRPGAHL